jgi:hypothetical protein
MSNFSKIVAIWVAALCGLIEVYHRLRGHCCCLHHQSNCCGNGGSKDLWNISKLLPDYMAVFWVIVLCSLGEVYHHLRSPCCWPHRQGNCCDDGSSKGLWYTSKLLPDYMALQPKSQPSLYWLPWEPQILTKFYYFLNWFCILQNSKNTQHFNLVF